VGFRRAHVILSSLSKQPVTRLILKPKEKWACPLKIVGYADDDTMALPRVSLSVGRVTWHGASIAPMALSTGATSARGFHGSRGITDHAGFFFQVDR